MTRLGPEGYTDDVTSRVYQTMSDRAATALAAGHSVIADAVHATAGDREAIAAVARRIGVPFIGLWLDGPREILATRLRERVTDASDATADVLDLQLRTDIGPLDWHRLGGSRDAKEVQQAAERVMASSIRPQPH